MMAAGQCGDSAVPGGAARERAGEGVVKVEGSPRIRILRLKGEEEGWRWGFGGEQKLRAAPMAASGGGINGIYYYH